MRVSVLAAAVAIAACSVAQAAPITYTFTGTVTGTVTAQSPPPVLSGQQVAIAVTVDSLFPVSFSAPGFASYSGGFVPPSPIGSFPGGFVSPSPVLSATINGASVLGASSRVEIQDDIAGVSSIRIISTTPQSSPSAPQTSAILDLLFITSNPGVVTGLSLPNAINPQDFDTATFRLTAADSAFTITGTIDAAVAIPAPGSLWVLPAGLVMLAAQRVRRRVWHGAPARAA